MRIAKSGNDSITDSQLHSARRADRKHRLSDLQRVRWGEFHWLFGPGVGLGQVQFAKILAAVKMHENNAFEDFFFAPGDHEMLSALENMAIRHEAPRCDENRGALCNDIKHPGLVA